MRADPETKKAQLIADLTEARREVLGATADLHSDLHDTPFLGTWSAHDIAAHLTGWDYANLEAIEAIRTGQLPAFYAAYDPDWRTFNAGIVARYKRATLAETLAAVEASHQALIDHLVALPAGDLHRDYGVRSSRNRRVTIAMLLGVEARDEQKHAAEIRAFATRGD